MSNWLTRHIDWVSPNHAYTALMVWHVWSSAVTLARPLSRTMRDEEEADDLVDSLASKLQNAYERGRRSKR